MDLRERVIGSVLGLALGDALGAPFHGLRAHQVPHPLPVFELPWMGFSPGVTTDATAMARNLGLLMRKVFGIGTPRGLQAAGGLASLLLFVQIHIHRLWHRLCHPQPFARIAQPPCATAA